MNQVLQWAYGWYTELTAPRTPPSQPTFRQKTEARSVKGTPSKGNEDLRKKFFEQEDDPDEPRTRFQDRMQSGGA